ncbi:hypothetical protein [Paracoccus sediminis]|uniref:Uncharacterized protein n=1 Tax=Paracoccus sediminis TaxID=1214787 RepID=A0A238XK40_9RHOB|nr:hypothetical protein [Paracoccus sediminis]SNR58951.1 hypothetical protein SAMN06265378_110103 [Paracoccus sediminis]
MSDISVSERRLSAALDRIDQYLDRGGVVHASASPDLRDELDAAHARIAALTEQMSQGQGAGQDGQDLADHAARLAAANDELAAANRTLIQAAAGDGDRVEAVSVALEAEIEALRAARAAESAQLGALLAEVERLLAENETSAATPEIAGDAGGVPEDSDAQGGNR